MDNVRFERRLFEFAPNNKVILKDGVLEVGALRIAGQLYRQVFSVLALVADLGFTVLGCQCIEVRPRGHTTFDNLFNQLLFELAVLAVEIIALVTGQHTGGIGDIGTHALTRGRQVVVLVDVLLKSLKIFFMIHVDINRVCFIATQ
ncbi:hypothetical protein [Pseudomonas helleri]|uniref:hypothetical protein n=1 Tax=Pseudomonas helleri TaxID=1608996 RepID=UPI003FD3F480